ncbi:hypothetical protein [Actinomycetospora straminea]|uniref:DUF4129 domain-containing protein n=1 Tax=Actinomycetospora straminea TaxID=663607 RepID=A0ABP9F3T6_9PSEU|nr:hypothetical protein [Actinomycetospora straminea]MDD7936154.1 hypothetical protein [Actinomycetospora straminea]
MSPLLAVLVLAPPAPSAIAPAGGGWGWAQTVALIVPVLAALGAVALWTLGQRAARWERRSNAFAAALAAVESFAEMPYRIRRRPAGGDARQQLTDQISAIQADIAFHQAWLELEAPTVAEPYQTLVRAARGQAGAQMHQAWTHQPLDRDEDMNLHIAYPREQIDAARADCLAAMRDALRLFRAR